MPWDGFVAIERDVRAMVADPRWSLLPMNTRADAIARRALIAADGSWWLFGASARWYRLDRGDGRWHLAAPPSRRGGTRVATAAVPYWLVPTGPDFNYDRGSTQAFVGPDVPPELTERVRALMTAHRALNRKDFPLPDGPFRAVFAAEVTSAVAAVWGTVMWSAYAPAFDGNEVLLSMFGEFLGRPLPGDEWVRWLRPVSIKDLIELYAERERAGEQSAALRLAGLMAETATVLRADLRFRPRADALKAMVEPLLAQPWLGAEWLRRCPPHLAPAILAETDPGEHFRHVLYDLVQTLGYLADPRATAMALIAADVNSVTNEAVTALYPWIDDELRASLYAVLADPAHPLRAYWPVEGRLPKPLTPPDRSTAAALLGAAYATGLAWCELAGQAPPATGFPVAKAVAQALVHDRDDSPTVVHRTPGPAVSETTSDWLYHN